MLQINFYYIIWFIVWINVVGFAQVQFIEHTIDSNVHGTGGLYACDIDKDNDLDVLGASLQDNQIILWRNDGGYPIAWTKIIIGSNIFSAHSVHAADFDGDDTLDVVSAQYSGTPGVSWWKTNSVNPMSWTKYNVASSFINAHEVYSYDIDKDGDYDVLGASSDLHRIAWWRNDGGNPIAWTEQILSSSVTLAKSVAAADLDDDQDNDIIGVSIVNNDVIWWRNDGGQPIQWTQYTVDGNFGGAHRIQAIDIDDDNDLDLLGAGYLGHQIAWWRNDGGNPIIWTKQIIGTNFTNACIAFAIDIDGDTDNDVIGTGQGINQIAWWRNDGGDPIQWTKFTLSNNFVRPWPLFACDLDGDLDNDIIVGSSHNGGNYVKWWENIGISEITENEIHPKNFNLKQNYPNPFNPVTKISYSLNNSTNTKIFIINSLGQKVKVLFDNIQPAGTHEIIWDATDDFGNKVSSGIYYYQIKIEEILLTKRMILLK